MLSFWKRKTKEIKAGNPFVEGDWRCRECGKHIDMMGDRPHSCTESYCAEYGHCYCRTVSTEVPRFVIRLLIRVSRIYGKPVYRRKVYQVCCDCKDKQEYTEPVRPEKGVPIIQRDHWSIERCECDKPETYFENEKIICRQCGLIWGKHITDENRPPGSEHQELFSKIIARLKD
jgi:hypothetical protein